jgi:hypothetical protein
MVEPAERVETVAVEGAGDLERDGAAADRAQPGEGDVLELEMALGFGHGLAAAVAAAAVSGKKNARAGSPCARDRDVVRGRRAV